MDESDPIVAVAGQEHCVGHARDFSQRYGLQLYFGITTFPS